MSEVAVRKILREFGLTEKEMDIYIFLAKQDILKGGEIAKQTKTTKALVYRILRSLQAKGIVESTVEFPARDNLEPECRRRHGTQPVGRPHGPLSRHGHLCPRQGAHLQWPWRASTESRRCAHAGDGLAGPQADQLRPRPLSDRGRFRPVRGRTVPWHRDADADRGAAGGGSA